VAISHRIRNKVTVGSLLPERNWKGFRAVSTFNGFKDRLEKKYLQPVPDAILATSASVVLASMGSHQCQTTQPSAARAGTSPCAAAQGGIAYGRGRNGVQDEVKLTRWTNEIGGGTEIDQWHALVLI
jgi:hypothetical protein